MKYEPLIHLNEVEALKLTNAQKLEFVNCCPKKVFGLNKKSNNIDVINQKECINCNECI